MFVAKVLKNAKCPNELSHCQKLAEIPSEILTAETYWIQETLLTLRMWLDETDLRENKSLQSKGTAHHHPPSAPP